MVSSVGGSAKPKANIPGRDYSRAAAMKKITSDFLPRFEYLRQAPDILYWLMGTWVAESGLRLLHPNRDGRSSSRHVEQPPKPGGIVWSYDNSNVIKNQYKRQDFSQQLRLNIQEGWCAHGISGTMGCYYVAGCDENLNEYRKHKEARDLIDLLQIEVQPGQSISETLFLVDNEDTWKKSIASGMIIMNAKYRSALLRNGGNTSASISASVMSYVGQHGYKDILGTSPLSRQVKLTSDTQLISILEAVGVSRSGETTVLAQSQLDSNKKDADAFLSTRVSQSSSSGPTTSTNSAGVSAPMPNCETTPKPT